jgi:hypothetical protein
MEWRERERTGVGVMIAERDLRICFGVYYYRGADYLLYCINDSKILKSRK